MIRKFLLGRRLWSVAIVAVALLTSAAIVFAARGSTFGLPGDRTTTLTAVATVASFVLVLVTLVVALVAYLVATGPPRLRPIVILPFSQPNELAFTWQPNDGGLQTADPYKQLFLTIDVENTSRYAARNPGVRLDLINCAVLPEEALPPEWAARDFVSTFGVTSLQWDGGADHLIHGRWVRRLPSFSLDNLRRLATAEAALRITLVADGWGPWVTTLPIGDRSHNPT